MAARTSNLVTLLAVLLARTAAVTPAYGSSVPPGHRGDAASRPASAPLRIAMNTPSNPGDHTIALGDVTSFGIAGTQPIDVSSDETRAQVAAIRGALNDRPSTDRAFVVRGQGTNALREAHGVLVSGAQPATSVRSTEPNTLVFFTRASNVDVHLTGVEQRGNTIVVTYRFVLRKTKVMTAHFALIPLSGLPRGTVRVEIAREPGDEAVVGGAGRAEDIVCRPSDFTVTD